MDIVGCIIGGVISAVIVIFGIGAAVINYEAIKEEERDDD